jgi:murein DD-endopeptidase MepM/ murein hydrolase activator NlpD
VDNRESVTSEVSRSSCNAAAMLGLALSLGTGSLIAPTFQSPVQAAVPAPVKVSVLNPVVASPAAATSIERPAARPVGAIAQPPLASPTAGLEAASPAGLNNAHAVKSGETLWQIAQVYKIDVRALASANQLAPGTVLKVGQLLKLPTSAMLSTSGTVNLAQLSQSTPALSAGAQAVTPDTTTGTAVVTPSDNGRIKSELAELGEASKLTVSQSMASKSAPTAPSAEDGLPVTKLANVPLPAIGGPEPQAIPQAIIPQTVDVSSDAPVVPTVVAATKSQPMSAPADAAPPVNPTPLLAEIHNLRNRQNRQKLASTTDRTLLAQAVTPTEPVSSKTVAANPDFAGRKAESALSIELRNFVNPKLKSESGEAAKPNAAKVTKIEPQKIEPQVVARASVGTEVDATPVTPAVQQMVRPNLPSIGRQDAYIPGGSSSQGFVWPSQGLLSSGYGWRWGRMHRGIDIAAPIGTPIVAVASGKVIYAGWNDGGYGYMVEVEHEDGTMTRYAHNNRILVEKGQQVAQGQQISEMGSTGFSTGPHLHFEIHPRGGEPVNPMAFLGNQS